MKTSKKFAIAAIPFIVATHVNADVRINGFGNVVAGVTSTGDEAFNLNNEVAYNDSVQFDQDSLFALQISADINSKMTATGQIVARAREDYDAKFEWAYITYNHTDKLSVSFGRLRAPFFKFSSSTDVGYSYHWITAPGAVYDVGFTNLNGFRVDYANYIGDWEYALQAAGGTYESELGGGTLSGKDTLVFTGEATYDWFKIRGVFGRAKASFSNDFFDTEFNTVETGGLTQLGLPVAAAPELADALRVEDDTGIFLGLGLEADFYDWFVSTEVTHVEQHDGFPGADLAYYVTGGMRLGKFTPSITYEKLDGTREDVRFQDIVAAQPPENQFALGTVNAIYQTLAQDEYSRISATIRYDVDTNMAIKAEVARFTDDLDDSGDNDYTLLRVAVQFVF